jgi:predicted DNA binding protein
MRRLILAFPKDELSKIESDTELLQKVKTLEVLLFLKRAEDEVTMICRLELENESFDFEDYLKQACINQIRIIEHEKSGSYVVLVKHKVTRIDLFGEKSAYAISREIKEGKFKMTFLGSENQMRKLHKSLLGAGIHYRIVSLTDAKFSSDSPINALTEKQREVLLTAYRLGYYDLPRRITSEQLSTKLKLHKSALATHRRKAELRILTYILKE